MDRREALKASSLILGYTLTAGTAAALLNGCKAETKSDWTPKTLSQEKVDMVAEICESILPKTETPGAKDALCHRYIDQMLTNFYAKEEQDYYIKALDVFNTKSMAKYSKAFIALNPGEREEILGVLAAEAKDYKDESGKKPHIFSKIKEATISGYFTSEAGAKGGLCAFLPVPGPYQGCIDYSTIGKGYVIS
jgi:hypothetical protein